MKDHAEYVLDSRRWQHYRKHNYLLSQTNEDNETTDITGAPLHNNSERQIRRGVIACSKKCSTLPYLKYLNLFLHLWP